MLKEGVLKIDVNKGLDVEKISSELEWCYIRTMLWVLLPVLLYAALVVIFDSDLWGLEVLASLFSFVAFAMNALQQVNVKVTGGSREINFNIPLACFDLNKAKGSALNKLIEDADKTENGFLFYHSTIKNKDEVSSLECELMHNIVQKDAIEEKKEKLAKKAEDLKNK